MRMIPIVAVVSEDTFHALNDHISSVEEPTPLLQAAMDRNGWTLDAVVAGACLKWALLTEGADPIHIEDHYNGDGAYPQATTDGGTT